LIAAAPPELPREVIIPDPLPMVVVLFDVRVVNAPVPAVVAPTDTKFATPPVVTLQLSSVIETPVAAEPPMVIVSAPPFPKIMVSAPVEPRVMVVAEVPVMVVALVVRVPEAVFSARFPAPPDAMVKAPESAMLFVVNV